MSTAQDLCQDYLPIDNVCSDPKRSQVEKGCAGCNLSGSALVQYWAQNNCVDVFSDILFTGPDGEREYNQNNLARVQENVNHLFETYRETNKITNVGQSGYSFFQESLRAMCQNTAQTPGVCSNYLCNRLCPQYTYDDMGNQLAIADWCGCFIDPPSDELSVYQDAGVQCYPLCHRASTIQQYNSTNGRPLTCSGQVCVIDDVSFNLEQSTIGEVNFNVMCPGCPVTSNPDNPDETNLCKCIISSQDLPEVLAEEGINANFSNYCGPNSACYVLQTDGTLDQVECDQFTTEPPPEQFPWTLFWFLIVIIVVGILAALAIVSGNNHQPSDPPSTSNKVNNKSDRKTNSQK